MMDKYYIPLLFVAVIALVLFTKFGLKGGSAGLGVFNNATQSATVGSFPAVNQDDSSKFKTYSNSNLGLSFDYPNDPQYELVDNGTQSIYFDNQSSIQVIDVSVMQKNVGEGNGFHFEKTTDMRILNSISSDGPFTSKTINGIVYKEFHRVGMGSSYGYTTKLGANIYVFESNWGPSNDIFEKIMQSVKFL